MDARPINATLVVDVFNPTGNPGEYSFDNAYFNNQSDQTGNGAYDVVVGYVIYVPSTNFNTGMQIPGTVHRYKLTDVNVIDPQHVSGTMVWDETGQEGLEIPTNGVGCALSQVSPASGYGFAPTDTIYPELASGITVQSIQTDLWNIADQTTSGGGPDPTPSGVYKTTIGNATNTSFSLTHSLATLDVSVTVYELSSGEDVYPGITRTGPNNVRIDFSYPIGPSSHRVIVRA